MSTLPPPIPGQPASGQPMTPPLSVEPAAPPLSEPQRIMNTFIAPSKTFEDLRRNTSWWVPWLLSAIIGLAFGVVVNQKMDLKRFMQQQIEQSPSAQKRLEQIPPEQRERVLDIQVTFTKMAFYASPVIVLLVGLLTALILWVIFSFAFGADVGFGRSLAIVFYASLPSLISSVMLIFIILFSSDPNNVNISTNPMPTTPAFFMDPQGNKFLYGLVSGLEIFKIWMVVLLGLGFAKASLNKKPSTGIALTTMFVVYAILIVGGAAFKAATS